VGPFTVVGFLPLWALLTLLTSCASFLYHMKPFHLREAPEWGFRDDSRRLCNKLAKSKAKNAPKWLQHLQRRATLKSFVTHNNADYYTVYTHLQHSKTLSETKLCTKPC